MALFCVAWPRSSILILTVVTSDDVTFDDVTFDVVTFDVVLFDVVLFGLAGVYSVDVAKTTHHCHEQQRRESRYVAGRVARYWSSLRI